MWTINYHVRDRERLATLYIHIHLEHCLNKLNFDASYILKIKLNSSITFYQKKALYVNSFFIWLKMCANNFTDSDFGMWLFTLSSIRFISVFSWLRNWMIINPSQISKDKTKPWVEVGEFACYALRFILRKGSKNWIT